MTSEFLFDIPTNLYTFYPHSKLNASFSSILSIQAFDFKILKTSNKDSILNCLYWTNWFRYFEFKIVLKVLDQSGKGDDRPIFANSEKNSCFWILRGSLCRIDLLIRLKDGWNPVFGPKLGPNIAQNPYLANRWLIPQNDYKALFTMDVLRYVYP